MKNTKLISALNVVVKSLQNGTIEYDWSKTNKCNCGLVAQAITGTSPARLFDGFLLPLIDDMQKKDPKFKDAAPTWQQMVGEYCPMTGMPTVKIFQVLFEAGLTRDDLGHLEALSDPKILAKAKISTASVTGEVTIPEQERIVKRKGFLGLFRKVEFKTVHTTRLKKKNYYESKANLLKYLKAWIQLLEEQDVPDVAMATPAKEFNKYFPATDNDLIKLRNKLVAAEKYVEAAEVRDELNRRNIAVGTAKEVRDQLNRIHEKESAKA